MVALGGLLQAVLVFAQFVLRRPRSAVDALQLRVLLAAAPVGGGDAGEVPAVADHAGAGQVRTAAEVFPDHLAVARRVVVDGEFARADLDGCTLRRFLAALEPDQLELERLVGEFGTRLVVGDDTTDEALALADDALHLLRDGLEVFGRERLLDAEVVVEAVGDRRADAEVRLRVDPLHRLREHVRRGVAEDVQAVGAVDRDRLDLVGVGHGRGEILEIAVDAHRDDVSVSEQGEAVIRPGVFRHRNSPSGSLPRLLA